MKIPQLAVAMATILLTVGLPVNGELSCIEAREECYNDPHCREVLGLLHHVCGPELVACSTVTPGKCQRLLRTLQGIHYLADCTCAEPHIDFACYTFRQTIFDHPCSLVMTDEPDRQIALPMCNKAHVDCLGDRSTAGCFQSYSAFIQHCSHSGITCTSKQSDRCNEAWVKIRRSPLFGCVCTSRKPEENTFLPGRSLRRGPTSYSYFEHARDIKPQEECLKVYNSTHANPCLSPPNTSRAVDVQKGQTTCHAALRACEEDNSCHSHLTEIEDWCEHARCEPDRCRAALQKFYENVRIKRRLEVAFCVCRQNDPDGECLNAMRVLHPTCAERQANREEMQCNKIAQQCRTSKICKKRLEDYEQKCAADAVTGQCSDTHRECQRAVMNILGTELHASCVCKGTDFIHHLDCTTWKKLLWSNPCVIESHLALQKEIRDGTSPDLDQMFTPAPAPKPPVVQPTTESTYGTVIYTQSGKKPQDPYPPPNPGNHFGIPTGRKHTGIHKVSPPWRRNGSIFKEALPRPPSGPLTNILTNPPNIHYSPRYTTPGPHHVMPTPPPTTTTTTTTAVPPTYYCKVNRPENGKVITYEIPAGKARRFYKDGTTNDCTLCVCELHSTNQKSSFRRTSRGMFSQSREPEIKTQVSCVTLSCIDNKSCNTSQAHYYHDTPWYKAVRGHCQCYGGHFICQKPEKANYTLGTGVFLFLGYSYDEMRILQEHTNKNEHEAVKEMEQMLIRDYNFTCKLETRKHLGENLILEVVLNVGPDDYVPYMREQKAKEKCAGPLEQLVKKINERPRHPDIKGDAHLSMFIVADLEVQMPQPFMKNSSSASRNSSLAALLVIMLLAVASSHAFFVSSRVSCAAKNKRAPRLDEASRKRVFGLMGTLSASEEVESLCSGPSRDQGLHFGDTVESFKVNAPPARVSMT